MIKEIHDKTAQWASEVEPSVESLCMQYVGKLPPRFDVHVIVARKDGKRMDAKDIELVKEVFPAPSTTSARRTKRSTSKRATGRKTTKRKAAKKPSQR